MRRIAQLFVFISIILVLGHASAFAKVKNIATPTCDVNGWCDIPNLSTNTKLFDNACEYRVYIAKGIVNGTPGDGYYYPIVAYSHGLLFKFSIGSSRLGIVNYKNKQSFRVCTDGNCIDMNHYLDVSSIQKRCKTPNQVPQGQVSLFHLAQCPIGWKLYNPNTMSGVTSQLVQCEKE